MVRPHMSSSTRGLFRRLKDAITSTLSDAVDSVSDPGAELGVMIDDLGAHVAKAEKDLHAALVERKVLEKKLKDQQTKVESWQGRAEQALKLGDEALARQALQQKQAAETEFHAMMEALEQQFGMVEQMRADIAESKSKHKALELRRGTLMQKARAVKHAEKTGSVSTGNASLDRINEIEAKITEMEARNEATMELHAEEVEAKKIEAKLRALDAGGGSAVDDELERLKLKIGAPTNKQLNSGGE